MFSKSKDFEDTKGNETNSSSVHHFFECIKQEKVEEIKKYFRDQTYRVWTLKEENDYTALHRAVFMNSEKITLLIIEELKKRLGVESKTLLPKFINEKTNEGTTALHYAAYRGNIRIAKALIENGANIEILTNRGKNVMHLAAEGNQPSIMIYFISYHAQDVFCVDEYGSTPLHWACYSGAEEAALFIISFKANIDAKDKEGLTPLHLAAISNREKIVLRLLQKGADKTIRNSKDETPLDVASKKHFYKCIKLLSDEDYSPLCTFSAPVEHIPRDPFYSLLIYILLIVPEFVIFLFILPFLESDIECYINLITFVLALLSYIFIFIKEPRYLINEGLEENQEEYPLKKLVDKEIDVKGYCPTCFVKKTFSSKHCFVCDKCIEGFDHHCFWLNKCIGSGNICPYMTFLFFSLIYSLYSIYIGVVSNLNKIYSPERTLLPKFLTPTIGRRGVSLVSALTIGFSGIFSLFLTLVMLIEFTKSCGCFKARSERDEEMLRRQQMKNPPKVQRTSSSNVSEKQELKERLLEDDEDMDIGISQENSMRKDDDEESQSEQRSESQNESKIDDSRDESKDESRSEGKDESENEDEESKNS